MLKDVLVHIDGSKVGAGRLAFAIDLADRFRARLTVAHVIEAVPPTSVVRADAADYSIDAWAAERIEDAAKARSSFNRALAGQKVLASWTGLTGDTVRELCSAGRYSDLVVLGQDSWQCVGRQGPQSLAEAIVTTCGRPVLVVPAAFVAASFRRVLLAWDGTREATRALHDAVPMLRQAGSLVEIVSLEQGANGVSLDGLKRHLQHHEIKVEVEDAKRTIGHVQALGAKQLAFDLLIMGASSTHAACEVLFGGAMNLLRQAHIPILMSY
jgi:nucleotide-binding universal stress UspA family protein